MGHQEDHYELKKGGTDCQTEDFHMESIDGFDVSTFMGFPFNATGFNELPGERVSLSGGIILPANTHFGEQRIDIKDVEMIKTAVTNSSGNIVLLPATLPFITDLNELKVTLPGSYKAVITDASGLKLDLCDQEKLLGEMKAPVQINSETGIPELNGNFGGYNFSLPDLFLATKPASGKAAITVYSSKGQTTSANTGNNGFYLSDGKSETLAYSVGGFNKMALAQPDESFFDKNGLTLRTRLKASIPTLNPKELEIDAGTIRINKQGLTTLNQKPFTVKMGNWTLNCDKWAVSHE